MISQEEHASCLIASIASLQVAHPALNTSTFRFARPLFHSSRFSAPF
jgi:hypothetical protein